ncbi:MAG: histidine phosphatase family protein [Phycisphaeraceae bacterium]|nr:histidine phosphatase family protein [Phycisphaeraceae bacterium]MCW5763929.1 histidine phosphatase family protein [Phycisphaeraceae bacterium]
MSKTKAFSLFLVRSNVTQWDESDRLVGGSDLPMCDSGRAGMEAQLDQLSDLKLDLVLCSPDESTTSAAQMLATAANARLKQIPDLGEVNLGLWEGLRESELAERYPTAFKQWLGDPSSVQVPGGESLHDAELRILDALIRALEKTKSGHTRIGIVVRPMAWAIIRCWMRAVPLGHLWTAIKEGPCLEWHEVDREQLSLASVRAES